ncbi:MAG: hypothetical protein U1E53_09370 [Dongiaceae bacterium]
MGGVDDAGMVRAGDELQQPAGALRRRIDGEQAPAIDAVAGALETICSGGPAG